VRREPGVPGGLVGGGVSVESFASDPDQLLNPSMRKGLHWIETLKKSELLEPRRVQLPSHRKKKKMESFSFLCFFPFKVPRITNNNKQHGYIGLITCE
jgi:hypothetical protein